MSSCSNQEPISAESIVIETHSEHPFLKDHCKLLKTLNAEAETIDEVEIYCNPGSGCASYLYEDELKFIMIDCNGEWYEILKATGTIKDAGWHWLEDPEMDFVCKYSSSGKKTTPQQLDLEEIYQYKDPN